MSKCGFVLHMVRTLFFCGSGKLPWEQVLKYARLRKRYIPLYISLLKSDLSRLVVDDNKEIEELDRELDNELILQWRYLTCLTRSFYGVAYLFV